MAWRNTAEARPLVLPMYYTHPEDEAAYHAPNQYWFGSELIAAPYVTPRDPDTRLSSQAVWLPAGDWFDFFTGERLSGGRWHTFYGTLAETPLLARAGAIVPLGPRAGWGSTANPAALEVHLFPGASNAFELYEDDGESQAYRAGQACRTLLAQRWNGDSLEFSIAPAEGDAGLIPARRSWRIALHGLARPDRLVLRVNGVEQNVPWRYGALSEELALDELTLAPSDRLELRVEVRAGSLTGRRDRRADKVRKLLWNFLVPDVNVCQKLDDRLPELLAGALPLEQFAARLSGGQLDALRNALK
jgi:hypothetical protein